MNSNIDAILYINLDHRTDRDEHVMNEIHKICNDDTKIHRISAIKKDPGALGCTLSHIKALEYALEHPEWKTVLILEDDFTFVENQEKRLNELFTNNMLNWDIVSLSYNPINSEMIDCNIDGFMKVKNHLTASGYILRNTFIETLYNNFKESSDDMIKNGKIYLNCLDVHWYNIQYISKWYAFRPAIGYQMDSYSDIEKKYVSYKC